MRGHGNSSYATKTVVPFNQSFFVNGLMEACYIVFDGEAVVVNAKDQTRREIESIIEDYRRIKAVGTRPTALNKSTVAELDVIAPICNSHLGTKVQTYFLSPKHFRHYFPKHDDFAILYLQNRPSSILHLSISHNKPRKFLSNLSTDFRDLRDSPLSP